MTYSLDTNVLSALMRGSATVNARLNALSREDVFVAQPTMAEVAFGIARLPESKRKRWLKESFAIIVATIPRAEWTDDVSQAFATIKATLERRGELIEDFDIAIAAHAVAADAVLVTADRKHMPRIPGLTIEDWSEP